MECKKYFYLWFLLAVFMTGVSITSVQSQDFDFDDILDESPDQSSNFIEARMLMITGQHDEAAEKLEILLENDPNNAIFLYELARCYAETGDNIRALGAAEQASLNDPNNTWILQLLANLAGKNGRDDLAENTYGQLLQLHPERSNYAINQAYHLLLMGDRQKALNVLNEVEKTTGINPEISLKKISILRNNDETDEVEKEYKKLVGAFPENIDYRMELATFLESEGKTDSALREYRRILELDPTFAQAKVRISELEFGDLSWSGRLSSLRPLIENPDLNPDEKIKAVIPALIEHSENFQPELSAGLLETAAILVDLHSGKAEVHALAGDIAFTSYQYRMAIDHYQDALQLQTNIVQVWFNLMESILKIRDFDLLNETVIEGMDFYPNQALFNYYLFRSHLGNGELSQANSALRRAKMIGQRQRELHSYFAVGDARLAFENGEPETALEIMEEAIKVFPNEGFLWVNYAELLFLSNKKEANFDKALNKAKALMPNEPELIFLEIRHKYEMEKLEDAAILMEQLIDYDMVTRPDIFQLGMNIFEATNNEKAELLRQKKKKFNSNQ